MMNPPPDTRLCTHCGQPMPGKLIEHDGITIDPENGIITVDGVVHDGKLSKQLTIVFSALLSVRGRVLSKAYLYDQLWPKDEPEFGYKTIDVLILKLRRQLPRSLELETVWGRGYQLFRRRKK